LPIFGEKWLFPFFAKTKTDLNKILAKLQKQIAYEKMIWTEDFESGNHFVVEEIAAAGSRGQLLGLPDGDGGRGVQVHKHGLRFIVLGRLRNVDVGLMLKIPRKKHSFKKKTF
jgi:hypothetical protein